MFYTEEDIQPAVDMATELFGTVGNMSNEKTTLKNIVIVSDQFGGLWYGDLDESMDSVKSKCIQIGQKFNINVSLINQH